MEFLNLLLEIKIEILKKIDLQTSTKVLLMLHYKELPSMLVMMVPILSTLAVIEIIVKSDILNIILIMPSVLMMLIKKLTVQLINVLNYKLQPLVLNLLWKQNLLLSHILSVLKMVRMDTVTLLWLGLIVSV